MVGGLGGPLGPTLNPALPPHLSLMTAQPGATQEESSV